MINTLSNTVSAVVETGRLVRTQGNFVFNVASCASCATNYWVGKVSNAWENAANWSCGTVPGPSTNVIINAGTVIVNSNVTINKLYVNPGVSFTVNTGQTLNVLH